jgi:hypothetical protein
MPTGNRAVRTARLPPRLRSDDPFRFDMHGAVKPFQNGYAGALKALGASGKWRGGRNWSTNDAHQRVLVKVRYRTEASKALAYTKYMVRSNKGLDGEAPEVWDDKEKGFNPTERVRQWMREEEDPRWFKIVYSPEKPFGDLEGMIKHVMTKAEEDLGTKLEWFAARHHDGGRDHAHVFLRGRGDDGMPLNIEKQYVRFGFRDSAQNYVTNNPEFGLGERSAKEIAEGVERTAQIRQNRDAIKQLVAEARNEGLLDKHEHDHLIRAIGHSSPKGLEQYRVKMHKKLDGIESMLPDPSVSVALDKETSAGRSSEQSTGIDKPQPPAPASRESLSKEIETAERSGRIDALEADKLRHRLEKGSVDEVHKTFQEVEKRNSGAARDAGLTDDAERTKRKGGLSL